MGAPVKYLFEDDFAAGSAASAKPVIKQSQAIADNVSIELDLTRRHFPTYTPPENKTPAEFLRELCIQGLRERYADKPERWVSTPLPSRERPGEGLPTHDSPLTTHAADCSLASDVLDRLDRELSVINKLGFPNYFLIVWDFVRYAREQRRAGDRPRQRRRGARLLRALSEPRLPDQVRPAVRAVPRSESQGSARYRHRLLQGPPRRDHPLRQGKVRRGKRRPDRHVRHAGGQGGDHDVGRVLGCPIAAGQPAQGAWCPSSSASRSTKRSRTSDELKQVYDTDPEVREVLDLARKIEGLARNVGTHAAAVVIADKPLTEYVPLCRVKDKTDIITQWSMGDVEAAGLLKMDFLGLRNLTILTKAVDLIEQTTGERVDPYKFPLDDKKTFALLCRGETKGIFQLESGGIRDLLQKMKPDHFRDIIATNALYRPGPLEGGMVEDYVAGQARPQAGRIHPSDLREDPGRDPRRDGLSRAGDADPQRAGRHRAGRRLHLHQGDQQEEGGDDRQEPRAVRRRRARPTGLSEQQADDFLEPDHQVRRLRLQQVAQHRLRPDRLHDGLPQGPLSGRVHGGAALGRHPRAATSRRRTRWSSTWKTAERMGIDVVPPDVNRSRRRFHRRRRQDSVRPVARSRAAAAARGEAIVAARKKGGPFRDLFDFCERVDPPACSRATIETLIKAGAFDSLRRPTRAA